MRQYHKRLSLQGRRLQRPILIAQLLATAAALALVPGNLAKLASMLLVWALGFRCISPAELALMICIDAIFVAMDIATTHQGAFRFLAPDLLGLPYYEFFMWGFYVLNAIRFWDAKPPQKSIIPIAIGWVVLFALPFSLVRDYHWLLIASGAILAVGIGIFHERRDLCFIGYMIAMGAIIEYAGVQSHQWIYHGATLGGVPLWFVTMWGGIGLFIHRLGLPLIHSFNHHFSRAKKKEGANAPSRFR